MKKKLIELLLKGNTSLFNRYIKFNLHLDINFKADLSYTNLSSADLSYANLSSANLRYANLRSADLRSADLSYTNLSSADLSYANLDFSCMPLWCGDLEANYDDKQIIQQLYHVMSHVKNSNNISDGLREEILTDVNLKLANKFHRIAECGKL